MLHSETKSQTNDQPAADAQKAPVVPKLENLPNMDARFEYHADAILNINKSKSIDNYQTNQTDPQVLEQVNENIKMDSNMSGLSKGIVATTPHLLIYFIIIGPFEVSNANHRDSRRSLHEMVFPETNVQPPSQPEAMGFSQNVSQSMAQMPVMSQCKHSWFMLAKS